MVLGSAPKCTPANPCPPSGVAASLAAALRSSSSSAVCSSTSEGPCQPRSLWHGAPICPPELCAGSLHLQGSVRLDKRSRTRGPGVPP